MEYTSDNINGKRRLSFEEMYEYAKIYYEHYGNLEIPAKFKTNNGYERDENGKINLGMWIAKQRERTSPESERGQLLSQIGMRFEAKSLSSFKEMYEYAKIYYEYHGNLEVPVDFKTNNGYEKDKNGKINLGTWIQTQRRNVLPESERGQLLSQIGMRFEAKSLSSFKEMYEYAKIYYEYHGNLEVPVKFKTNNGYERDENGKINLGTWVESRRKDISPESVQGQLLSQIGMRFERKYKYNIISWEEMYEYAKKYYEYHGNLEVPDGFKTNNGYEKDENGKINLGTWIQTQRRYASPESERGRLLSKIKMRFPSGPTKKINKLSFEEMYGYAQKYYEHHGNLEVPLGFKTNNGYERDENGKINLGVWISNRRINTPPESIHGQLLSKIGMRFELKYNIISWEEMYEYARKYYKHHGNLEVPVDFKTNNGYERDENGKINLGTWIQTQRRNVLPESERGQLLSQIRMRFELKYNIISWEEMYEYARKYYEYYGNLKVPVDFKTNNGYERDENGEINLGTWIQTQRRNVSPESERGQLLSQIGMIWNVRTNKEEIERICAEQNIDIKINKTIISHISVQEFQSKISLLREKNIPLVDLSGQLHLIFSMSNINMQANYGIDLEQLINDYYISDKKERRIK